MDTNQNNTAQNYQINAFTKGMNTDTSYDMLNNEQYVFGLNIRITNNTLLNKLTDANSLENIVAPIKVGDLILLSGISQGESVLAINTIGNVGAIVTKTNIPKWITTHSCVYDLVNKTVNILSHEEGEEYDQSLNITEHSKTTPMSAPEQISKYLYKIDWTDELDYGNAFRHFEELSPGYMQVGACSSIRQGNYYGRNLDWTKPIDDSTAQLDFVIQTYGDGEHTYNALQVASMPGFTISDLNDKEKLKLVPFYAQDGINEKGVFCNVNVVSREKRGSILYSVPTEELNLTLCANMLCRYILDNYSNATDAVTSIEGYISLFVRKGIVDMNYDLHFMIGDENNTYVLEVIDINSQPVVVYKSHNIMTNFYINGVTFNDNDGTVYTNADASRDDGFKPTEKGVTPNAAGLERYNILALGKDEVDSVKSMRILMNKVLYSKAYDRNTDPFWYSEFLVPEVGITVDTNINDSIFNKIIDNVINNKNYWRVYRIELKNGLIETELKFTSTTTTNKDRFSTVINKEIEDHVKLYIADGEHEVMCLDLDDEIQTSEDALISNKVFPTNPVMIEDKISGLLKTQQVQYTYRFYKKFGITSRLAPLTNKIQVIDNNRNREIGNAEDTVTSIGFKLSIEYTEDIQKLFDHILIFRLSYIKPGQNAEVNLIYDAQIDTEDSTKIYLNDTGILSLAQYTIEEFAALYGTVIVPQVLELNQGYLFAGNIKDNSIIEFKEGGYDARAFRFNNGDGNQHKANIYKENLNNSILIGIDDLKTLSLDYTILLFSDINNPTEDEYQYSRLINAEGKYYLGGSGLNIEWNFITKNIPLDDLSNENTINIKNIVKTDNDTDDINKIYYLYRDEHNNIALSSKQNYTTLTYLQQKGIMSICNNTYNDMFISSTFRSLARDEVYRYGIIFYDKYGIRSNTLWIADIRTPTEKEFPLVDTNNGLVDADNGLIARALGIEFKIKKPTLEQANGHDIIGYQIVRCEKSNQYTKNLMQCALSRPLCQGKYNNDTYRTPYYPNMFLSTQFFYIRPGVNILDSKLEGSGDTPEYKKNTELWAKSKDSQYPYFDKGATNVENRSIYLLFSPEILYWRQDTLTELSGLNNQLLPILYVYNNIEDKDLATEINGGAKLDYDEDWCLQQVDDRYYSDDDGTVNFVSSLEDKLLYWPHKIKNYVYLFPKWLSTFTQSAKNDITVTTKYYSIYNDIYNSYKYNPLSIKNIEDVQNPTWEQGFSNVQLGSNGKITTAIKEYKSFTTSVGTNTYLNWICNGMYNLAATKDETSTQPGNNLENRRVFTTVNDSEVSVDDYRVRNRQAYGWIGPGPICFVVEVEPSKEEDDVLESHILYPSFSDTHTKFEPKYRWMGTIKANIQHTATQFAGLTNSEKQYDVYYGFGNYGWFKNDDDDATTLVFDGTKYITPVEFINMYKTYDFNDIESTIPSGLMVYYIPMESDVNTYFDYGMNYRNTSSANILVEPGTIDGVKTLDRAVHQYNRIYSDNHVSNDVFSSQSLETTEYVYPQRIYYSLFKTNGEYIDNWLIFKPADMIDADTRYGLITNLLSSHDILYFWQTNAFGKLSVNERSLVTDNNSNTVLLGQGGVLQRTDYISTHYGMREQDFSAITAEDGIFWIDILNNAIVAASLNQVINYGEALYVQNIVNHRLEKGTASVKRPTIDYDILNQELICNILRGNKLCNDQLIFSLKLKAATSIYTRDYDVIANFNNTLYGVNMENINATKYNYLDLNSEEVFLSPTILSFVVNSSPSLTKVFDNQKVVVLNKGNYNEQYGIEYFKDRQYDFLTEMNTKASINKDNWNKYKITDRENNICYIIPRFGNSAYGNRLRGKWMRETITDTDPKYNFAISHMITKFRQSYS